jgi:uncharacterized membrane protein
MTSSEQLATVPGKPVGILGLIGFFAGIVLAYLKALKWSHGTMTAEVFGYAVGGVLLPFLISYVIAGRRKSRDWNKVGIWFLLLSLVFYLIERTP